MTVNGSGEERPRFIESENFNLWHYLVTNKHSLQVVDPMHCLRVPASDFAQRVSLYSHAGEVEPVNRVIITMYDEAMGFTSVVERFAHRSEVFTLMNILNTHFSAEPISEESLESAVIPGYAVEPSRAEDMPNLTPAGPRNELNKPTLY